jgi:hypothetical protein
MAADPRGFGGSSEHKVYQVVLWYWHAIPLDDNLINRQEKHRSTDVARVDRRLQTLEA